MEEKGSTTATTTTTTTTRNYSLSLNLNGNTTAMDVIDETTNLLASERCDSDTEGRGGGGRAAGAPAAEERNPLLDASQREDSFGSDASSRKIKMSKLQTTATKGVALKR